MTLGPFNTSISKKQIKHGVTVRSGLYNQRNACLWCLEARVLLMRLVGAFKFLNEKKMKIHE